VADTAGEPSELEILLPRDLAAASTRLILTRWAAGALVILATLASQRVLGVILRRNLLVMYMSLELMLNSANLALVGFSRYWNDTSGQIFALVVMVVAAAEVVIGLGLVVSVFRQRGALDVDEMSELRG